MKLTRRFEQYFAWIDTPACLLPVQFGGVTQCGRINEHNNNQDSLALWARESCVVGVLCDGCSSSSLGYSNNEVGARLLSIAAVNIIGAECVTSGVEALPGKLPALERDLCERILRITEGVAPDSKRDTCLESLFMTTVLVFAFDAKNYCVFGCGDGLFGINGKITSLVSEDGRYLAGRLMAGLDWESRLASGEGALRVHASGNAEDINNIILGSDGFQDLTDRFGDRIHEYLNTNPDYGNKVGYADWLAADFRRRVWLTPDVQKWAETQDGHDDRSFILLRRMSKSGVPQVLADPKGGKQC